MIGSIRLVIVVVYIFFILYSLVYHVWPVTGCCVEVPAFEVAGYKCVSGPGDRRQAPC